MEKKQEKWIYPRHRFIRNLAYLVFKPICKWKYNVDISPFTQQGDRQYLILCNHQTPFDQFFMGIAFKGPIYYVATEDIFSLGFVSSLLRYFLAPIPIKKQTTDLKAVKNCIKIAREGGTIAMAPEGNRTYSGKTEYMNPSVAKLARHLKLPVALFRIEGGYGSEPRWSDVVRKGRIRAYVSRVIEPEEYEKLTNDELFTLISDGLYVNEACADYRYEHKNLAEYLERAVYVCPYCGLSTFYSKGDTTECLKCHRKIRYLPTKQLQGIGFDFPFPFVNQWYEYQKDYVNQLNTGDYTETAMYRDRAKLSQVIVYKKKLTLRKDAEIALYGDRIVIDEGSENELCLPFSEVEALSVLGRNKANIYHSDTVYQLKGDKHFNALKYVNIYYRHKNISRGKEDGKFLGL